MTQNEIWKDVPGYDGKYQVSNMGRVRGLPRNSVMKNGSDVIRKLKGRIMSFGVCGSRVKYHSIKLCKDSKIETITIHRLVATVFVKNPHGKPHINHINNNSFDNRATNLEWCTPQENMSHAMKNGRWDIRGEKQHLSKLNTKSVVSIRKMITLGIKFNDIANKFKIDPSTISDINRGKTWKHI